MPTNLRGRDFLTLLDFSSDEIRFLLNLAAELKIAKRLGNEKQQLRGKNVALIFEKSSTRTRTGFEVAAYDQGAHVTYLGPSGTQIGGKETMKDTARVLGKIYDGIEYRGFGQAIVQELADHAGVPVWNGLTDEFHPTQILADFMTMREYTHKHLSDIKFCYTGDGRSNMANSLMIGAAKVGMEIIIASPKSLWADTSLIKMASDIAQKTGAKINFSEDLKQAVSNCDFIYTDVWVSMGEAEEVWEERIKLLKPYQVTPEIMAATGNKHTKFMHCLPAFHNTDTKIGKQIFEKYGLEAMEVTEQVFESEASVVFEQAGNRMHTIKAVLVATMGM